MAKTEGNPEFERQRRRPARALTASQRKRSEVAATARPTWAARNPPVATVRLRSRRAAAKSPNPRRCRICRAAEGKGRCARTPIPTNRGDRLWKQRHDRNERPPP